MKQCMFKIFDSSLILLIHLWGLWKFGRPWSFNFAQHRETSSEYNKEYNLTQSWNPFIHAEKQRPNPKRAKRIQTSCSIWSDSRAQSFFTHRGIRRPCLYMFVSFSFPRIITSQPCKVAMHRLHSLHTIARFLVLRFPCRYPFPEHSGDGYLLSCICSHPRCEFKGLGSHF